MIYTCKYIEHVMSRKRKNHFRAAVRCDSGVAGEGRVVGVPRFHLWGKCTIPLTNINSDWMSNASSGLSIILFILRGSFVLHNNILLTKFCQCHWTLLLYYYLELQYPVNALRVLSQVDVGLYLYHWK